MIEEILPPDVRAVETFEDLLEITLFPEEEAAVAKAVDKRRHEFTTARACARAALAGLGLPATPIVPGPRGAPQWPQGIVGSMTHCAGYRAAVVARSGAVITVGIDAEPNQPLPQGVLDAIADADERAWVERQGRTAPEISWDRILFSAKESVYKAWFPLTGRWLGFEEATLTLDPERGTFEARILVPGPERFSGRWLARDGFVLTAITVLPAATREL